MPGHVWNEVAPERDVDELHPSADPEYRRADLDRLTDHRELRTIRFRLMAAAAGIRGWPVVEAWIHVLAAHDHDRIARPGRRKALREGHLGARNETRPRASRVRAFKASTCA